MIFINLKSHPDTRLALRLVVELDSVLRLRRCPSLDPQSVLASSSNPDSIPPPPPSPAGEHRIIDRIGSFSLEDNYYISSVSE